MRKILQCLSLLIALHLLPSSMHGQDQQKLDSLFKLLDDSRIDTIQMKVNRKIARMYMDNNQIKALTYFSRARDLAEKLQRPLELADNYYSIGYCYLGKGDLDQSLENYLQAVRHYEQLAYDPSLADAYLSIISVYGELKNFAKAKVYMQKAEQALLDSKDTFQLCSLYSQSGNIYAKEGKEDSAFYFMQKGLALAQQANDESSIIVALSNIGLAYKKAGKNELALRYCDSALQRILHRDDNLADLAMVHNNIGAIHAQAGRYAMAADHFSKSIAFAKEAGFLNVEMENYRNLSDMYEGIGDYKQHAFYLKKYDRLKDSIFNNESRDKIAQLETDYLLGKKNIEIIKKDASIQQQKNQRNVFMLFAFGTLLFAGATIYFNRRIRQQKKEVDAQNGLIHQQKEDLQHLNQVKDRLFSVISHDLRNPLNTLQSYLMLSDNESISADKRLLFKHQTIQAVAQTGNLLDNLLTWAHMQIRDTTPKRIPLRLTDIVQDVMDTLAPQANQKHIQFTPQIDDRKVIGDADIVAIAIRNIATNAIKFSHEHQQVMILGEVKDNRYALHIRDKGIGISKQQLDAIRANQDGHSAKGTEGEQGSGLGLFLVKQLLNKIKVPLDIESEEGKGSSFTLWFELV